MVIVTFETKKQLNTFAICYVYRFELLVRCFPVCNYHYFEIDRTPVQIKH
jgi:hypothetical protein